MDTELVFYLKESVDTYYPTGNEDPVNTLQAIERLTEDIEKFSDDEFISILISCFIPDLYSDMGKREKLYTKFAELLVGEWWRRIGGEYFLPTMRSGTEDVRLMHSENSIVCDAKIFRLGRSQKAPNPKDFLKLADVRVWMNNLITEYTEKDVPNKVVGGLVTYSSLHEWKRDSNVYHSCTDPDTPVVMLPYERLALLLKYKENFRFEDFFDIWNFTENGVVNSRNKNRYWDYIDRYLMNLIDLDEKTYTEEIKKYYKNIEVAVTKYKEIIENEIVSVRDQIKLNIDKIDDLEELKNIAFTKIEEDANKSAFDYLERIDKFRHY